MDTSQQATVISRDKAASVASQRQRRSIAEKRRIVEETVDWFNQAGQSGQ